MHDTWTPAQSAEKNEKENRRQARAIDPRENGRKWPVESEFSTGLRDAMRRWYHIIPSDFPRDEGVRCISYAMDRRRSIRNEALPMCS
ncbi:hypothetical protein JTB14_032110 [Gonioctena quinquepunctata]|nr:hypothetical protein JTB14_032110 [Gonioctena quinquepunctata]